MSLQLTVKRGCFFEHIDEPAFLIPYESKKLFWEDRQAIKNYLLLIKQLFQQVSERRIHLYTSKKGVHTSHYYVSNKKKSYSPFQVLSFGLKIEKFRLCLI